MHYFRVNGRIHWQSDPKGINYSITKVICTSTQHWGWCEEPKTTSSFQHRNIVGTGSDIERALAHQQEKKVLIKITGFIICNKDWGSCRAVSRGRCGLTHAARSPSLWHPSELANAAGLKCLTKKQFILLFAHWCFNLWETEQIKELLRSESGMCCLNYSL